MVPLISADAYARFLRLKGVRSIYICATDEHGTRTEIEAAKAGLDEDTYCQQIHARMLEVFRWFHVEFTHFGRTSCAENHALTQELFLKAEQHGAILEQEIKQLYSAHKKRLNFTKSYIPQKNQNNSNGGQPHQVHNTGLLYLETRGKERRRSSRKRYRHQWNP
jgi:methionyl-tRNA synthetase